MTGKGYRFIDKRILYVFEQNDNVGMRFGGVFRGLGKHGWIHNQRNISENLKFMVKHKKIVHIGIYYAPIQTRPDGSKFAVIEDPVERVVELDE